MNPASPPTTPKTLVWFRENRRYLRKVMAACQIAFVKKTGGGEHGCDAADEDGRFWHFVHHDPLLMFMWLHWGRGKDVPSHCSALLDADASFDTGVIKTPLKATGSSPSKSKKASPSVPDDLLSQATRTAISVQESLLSLMSPPACRENSGVVEAESNMKVSAALASRIRDLQSVVSMESTTEAQATSLKQKIQALHQQLLDM